MQLSLFQFDVWLAPQYLTDWHQRIPAETRTHSVACIQSSRCEAVAILFLGEVISNHNTILIIISIPKAFHMSTKRKKILCGVVLEISVRIAA